jgi:hypothetical protein
MGILGIRGKISMGRNRRRRWEGSEEEENDWVGRDE